MSSGLLVNDWAIYPGGAKNGAVLPAQFAPPCIAAPAVTRLAQEIELVHADGTRERAGFRDPSGPPLNATMEQSPRRKFFTLAIPILGGPLPISARGERKSNA